MNSHKKNFGTIMFVQTIETNKWDHSLLDIQENVENNTTIVWFDTADAGTNATDTSAAPEAEEAPHQQEEIVAKTIVSDDEDKNRPK